jgi:hypothetical protein
MKYILEIDGVDSTKYRYNLWEVVEFYDGTAAKNNRIFATDNLVDLYKELEKLS